MIANFNNSSQPTIKYIESRSSSILKGNGDIPGPGTYNVSEANAKVVDVKARKSYTMGFKLEDSHTARVNR